MLEEMAQNNCGCLIPGNIQYTVRQGSEQFDLGEAVSAGCLD